MNSLKGQLLIASPSLADPNFRQAVVLMFDHGEQGAGGVIINRETGKTISDLSQQVFQESLEWDKPIFLGGPVPGPLAAAHTIEELSDLEIIPGLFGTIDPEKLHRLVEDQCEPTIFIANYAGWGPGQLEREIEENSWLILPAKLEHIFWRGDKDLWKTVISEVGTKHILHALKPRVVPDDPELN